MTLLRLDEIVEFLIAVLIILLTELIHFGHVGLDSWIVDWDVLVILVRPTVVNTALVCSDFLALRAVDTEACVCDENGSASRIVLKDVEERSFLPLELVVAVDNEVNQVDFGKVFLPPCVVFLGFGLELGDFSRPTVHVTVVVDGKLWERQAKDVVVDSLDLGLDPALALLFVVSGDVHVDPGANHEFGAPLLPDCLQPLQLVVRN